MNQRQKIIVVALAFPILCLVIYAAMKEDESPAPQRGGMVTPNNAPAKHKVNAAAPKGENKSLESIKELEKTHLATIEATTEEDYAKLRAANPKLPETLEEFKIKARERSAKILNLTQEEFDKSRRSGSHARKHKGSGKPQRNGGRNTGRNRDTKAAVEDTKAEPSNVTADTAADNIDPDAGTK